MFSRPSILSFSIAIACSLLARERAQANLIALDNFETTSTSTPGFYVAGNINGQASTTDTFGYYTGAPVGNQIAGWQSGTGAFSAQVGGLANPLLASPPTTNDGSFLAAGNANARLQYRDLASTSPPVSSDYYFSLLLSESVASYTGSVYAGLGSSRAIGANATTPSNGFNIGFNNGALSLFYGNGTASYATESLLAAPTANQAYLVEVHLSLSGTNATFTPSIYDSTGTLVNNPGAQAVAGTINSSTDLGAFQSWVSANFTNSSPSKVVFDDFRFGTAESDVINSPSVPESTSAVLLALGSLGIAARRRKRQLS